jgi:glycosyltransferase involved in cell wall biosynthesis
LFVSTATAEGSPTAALEAMACGLPVVLTPSNNYAGIVRAGINGRVTSGWTVEDLAKAIDEFLADPARATSVAAASRAVAEEHRWHRKAELVTKAMLAAVNK